MAPLPTVLPPEEAREPQPSAPSLQPPPEPAAEAVQQPAAIEPMTLTTPPAEASPAPILEQQAPLGEPSVVPEAIMPLAAPAVDAELALPAPLAPPAPLQPPIEVVHPQPAPEAPPVAVHYTAPAEQVVAPPSPQAPVEAPVASLEPETSALVHIVLLRLHDGEVLEVGSFPSGAEASARAQEVVKQIAAAEGDSNWPFFAERYLRPDTIVSVDLLEESSDKWLGSSVRTRWANQSET